MKYATIPFLAAASLLLATRVLLAGEPDFETPLAPAPAAGGWEFLLAPYGFLSGLEGDVKVGPLEADFDYDFAEILDSLDVGLILGAQARYNRFSVTGDLIYLGVSGSTSTGRPLYDLAKLDLDAVIFTGLGLFRVWESPQGFLDVGAGGRVFYVDTELTMSDSGGIGPALRSEQNSTIIDGVVAAHLAWQLNEKWSVRFYCDIGSGDSDLTWQVWANIGYVLNDRTTFLAGWRHLAYEFSKGRADLDMSFSGPQIGVVFSF